MEHDAVLPFITAAKAKAVADDFVVSLLRHQGWSERRIFASFATYYRETLGIAPPARGGRFEYARDAFIYLLTFMALGFWTIAVGHIFYVLIDRAFPSALDAAYVLRTVRASVTFELSTILVAFPVFAFASRSIVRGLRARPEGADSGVRSWLTYLALVVAALVVLGDAIWFLNTFLQGDLSVRVALKSGVLVVLAGGVFGYYLATMRGAAVSTLRDRTFAGLAAAAVGAAIVSAFVNIGTPAQARVAALDDRRVNDLAAIVSTLNERSILPATLDEISASYFSTHDPVTHAPYEYARLGGRTYRLCATFLAASDDATNPAFRHGAGRQCFTRTAAGR